MGIIYYCDNITIIKFFQNIEDRFANDLNVNMSLKATFGLVGLQINGKCRLSVRSSSWSNVQ